MGLFARLAAMVAGSVLIAGAAGAGYLYVRLSPPPTAGEGTVYLVRPGDTLYSVSNVLEQRKLIRDAQAFRLWARVKGLQNRMQTGYYKLEPGKSAPELLDKLVSGDTEKIPYTIPEGYRIDQAAKNLDKYDLSSERYMDLARQPDPALLTTYPFLAETSGKTSLEGYLYPDTYYLHGSESQLIEAQLHRFQEVVMPLWQQRPASHKLTLDQTIKLASIVELEGLLDRELPVIAGVFLRRMEIGMKLESDPTTEYALGWHQGAKGLSLKDIQIDSPYNTYRYPGLPPTPIGNPGIAAIRAVLNPQRTPYLYFVARGDGTHAFSSTYDQHLQAIRQIYAGKS